MMMVFIYIGQVMEVKTIENNPNLTLNQKFS